MAFSAFSWLYHTRGFTCGAETVQPYERNQFIIFVMRKIHSARTPVPQHFPVQFHF